MPKILVGGMSSAGKSTLVASAYQVLDRWGVDVSVHELDVWSDTHACIFGDKPWEQRNKRGRDDGDPIHAEFRAGLAAFAADPAELVLGDLPGLTTNRSFSHVAGLAPYGVLVHRDPLPKDSNGWLAGNPAQWEQLMTNWGTNVIARVHSQRNGERPPPGHLVVAGLDRALIEGPAIEQFAELLLNVTLTTPKVAA